MTRINAVRSNRENHFLTWGRNASALVFAAVLIICSVTVGCSSDKPKPLTTNTQILPIQPQSAAPQPMTAPMMQAENKPVPKKPVVHKKPAIVNYTDKAYGVTFEYPRRYAIETGNAATEVVQTNPIPMNFIQPGGVALAAVEVPETGFQNTDFSSAFFNVSIHKTLTVDQCGEFAVPQSKSIAQSEPVASAPAASTDVAKQDSTTAASAAKTDSQPAAQTASSTGQPTTAKPSTDSASNSKLLLGDMELRATEAVSGEGTRQSDSKYFHIYQNGACYEFALNVTTDASGDGLVKHVDRDKVFNRLEQILATVKINPVAAPEVAVEAPAQTAPAATPAQ